PERFVELDPEVPLTLLDQRNAGKKLLLITNSEWSYAVPMMSYAFDRFLPKGMTWRDLFDVVILGARKPDFFSSDYPFYEVVTEEGLLKPSMGGLKPKTVYLGGSARQVEKHLGFSGDEILYIGDHMFGDVRATKAVLRWRTALILREPEQEIGAIEAFLSKEAELAKLMDKKEELERQGFQARLYLQRIEKGYGPKPPAAKEDFLAQLSEIRGKTEELDKKIGPLAVAAAELNNERWGLLMRAGNDKSLLAFQIERYADIYTSRVSNFLYGTPFVYLRSPRGSLPHDPGFVSEQV
ncbi:MAG: 5'-nucleotidase domain-containing protein, partial [Bdellovibrionota bacterium]